MLEVGWEALEHAGTNAAALRSSATGVFLGITNSDYGQLLMQQMDPPDLEAYGLTSSASTFAAGRLSYWLGLSGPSMSVDTACSSSLVAVHLACQSLRSGDCTTALAGGVNVLLSPEWFVVLSKANMLAPDGRCKTFDAAADGYVRGEGAGMLVLKRLSDAVADGDRIHAVIRGSAVNQDGRSSGITVPNGKAQQDVVRRALRAASVTAAEVDYVEAHGTGTPLGDPIELRALEAVLGERGDRGPLRVGSVKTNVGHLEPASGIAGLIKLVLALEHEEIPPHRNLGMLNPEISLDEPSHRDSDRCDTVAAHGQTPYRGREFLRRERHERARDRRGGTGDPPGGAAPTRPMHLLTLSAKSPAALTDLAARYQRTLARAAEGAASDTAVADICFTANTGREHFPHRLGIVGATAAELADSLTTAAGEDWAAAGVRRGHASYGSRPKAVFLFTGQGAQYPAMARTLYETEPVYARVIDRCDEVLTPVLGRSLRSVLDGEDGDSALIHRTEYTQPALFAVEYALAQLWKSWGIEPAAVLGHSVGELVAACVAGVLPAEDGLVLAARRGRADGGTDRAGVHGHRLRPGRGGRRGGPAVCRRGVDRCGQRAAERGRLRGGRSGRRAAGRARRARHQVQAAGRFARVPLAADGADAGPVRARSGHDRVRGSAHSAHLQRHRQATDRRGGIHRAVLARARARPGSVPRRYERAVRAELPDVRGGGTGADAARHGETVRPGPRRACRSRRVPAVAASRPSRLAGAAGQPRRALRPWLRGELDRPG
ncbi:hypothetical protein GCM10020000_13560 [Streptomyces olivoverticillatus]